MYFLSKHLFHESVFLSPLVFLTSVILLRCYDLWACVTKFWLLSWVCFFSAITSAFQLFIGKLCLQFSGLRMRKFAWNRFPIKNLLIDSLLTPIVESAYLKGHQAVAKTLHWKCDNDHLLVWVFYVIFNVLITDTVLLLRVVFHATSFCKSNLLFLWHIPANFRRKYL